MADTQGPTPDDRLTQMVQAAVSASLARRSSILKPREIQELTADARAQLEDLIRQRDADLQRVALLNRAREKLQEEIGALQNDLSTLELKVEDDRHTAARIEKRLEEVEREGEQARADLAKKAAEADETESQVKAAKQDAERFRAQAATLPVGAPSRDEAEARAAQLEKQVAHLIETREILRREVTSLQEALSSRDKDIETERNLLREAHAREEALQQQVTALAGQAKQKRGIEVKVFDEMSRAQSSLSGMVDRMAEIERSAELGPVIAELKRETDRVREEGRADRVQVAQLLAQLRDLQETGARSGAAAIHLRESLAAVEADRDRLDDLLRRERRASADRQRQLVYRIESLEARPPVGSDPAAWDRVRAQFEARLREAAQRDEEVTRDNGLLRTELENARALLTRATVERQQLRSRVEALELASVSSPSEKLDTLRADARRIEMERDDSKRETQAVRSRLEATQQKLADLEKEREKLERELNQRTGGGFFKKLGRAFGGE